MAYYLMISNKEEYRNIDVTKLDTFTKTSKFKGASYSLSEIDAFTMKYKDEIELKKDLYENGIINIDEICKDITIRRKEKDKYIKVKYGLAYKGRTKYFDQLYLRSTILSKQEDYDFLTKLSSYYRNSYVNNTNVNIISFIAYNRSSDEVDKVLNDFLERELYRYDTTSGKYKFNYKGLHDLAMFVYNYDAYKAYETLGYNKSTITNERRERLLELKKSLTSSAKSKKKIKKYPQNEDNFGQMSLFDHK